MKHAYKQQAYVEIYKAGNYNDGVAVFNSLGVQMFKYESMVRLQENYLTEEKLMFVIIVQEIVLLH